MITQKNQFSLDNFICIIWLDYNVTCYMKFYSITTIPTPKVSNL